MRSGRVFIWEDGPLAFLGQCWEEGVAHSSAPPPQKHSLGRVGGWGKACPSLSPNIHQALRPVASEGQGFLEPGRTLNAG